MDSSWSIIGGVLVIVAVIAILKYRKTNNTNFKYLTSKDFLIDFQYLYDTISACYPFLNISKELDGLDWQANYEVYLERFKNTRSDERFKDIVKDILEDLNNDHLQLLEKEELIFFYRIYSDLNREDWRYKKLMSILKNRQVRARYELREGLDLGRPRKDIGPDSNLEYGQLNQDVFYMNIKAMIDPDHISQEEIRDFEGLLEGLKDYQALVIDIRENSGGNSAYFTDFFMPYFLEEKISMTSYLFMKEDSLTEDIKNQYGYRPLEKERLRTWDIPERTRRHIGDFDLYKEDLWQVEPRENWQAYGGRIYILIGERVFSSSESFAGLAKETGFGKLVGSRTSGDGFISDPMLIALPRTGYVVRMPKEMAVLGNGTINELEKTEPDIYVKGPKTIGLSSGKLELNSDPLIERILEIEEDYYE